MTYIKDYKDGNKFRMTKVRKLCLNVYEEQDKDLFEKYPSMRKAIELFRTGDLSVQKYEAIKLLTK